jgi:hypothetical protein
MQIHIYLTALTVVIDTGCFGAKTGTWASQCESTVTLIISIGRDAHMALLANRYGTSARQQDTTSSTCDAGCRTTSFGTMKA